MPNLRALNFQKALNDITKKIKTIEIECLCLHYHESSDCFEYPQKSLLKSSHPPKKYLPNFATQKKSQNRKFQTQKNPLIIPVT